MSRRAALDRQLAVVGLLLAGDQPEQRRLAGPVGTDEPDLLALLERRGGFDEEDLVAVLLADAVETDHAGLGPGRICRALTAYDAPAEEYFDRLL